MTATSRPTIDPDGSPTLATPARARVLVLIPVLVLALAPAAGATTYYVSFSGGNDANGGTSSGSPFKTLGKVNSLNLSPGDQVRLFCGDTWRGERLIAHDSGTVAQPITFTSHPLACADQPVISGAPSIVGWTLDAGNVYRADLSAGGNAGRFPGGVNQLFRNGARLPYGRWPNLGTANGGYSTIDAQAGATITDNQLPAGNWTGAYVQHRGQFWYLLRRQVVNDVGSTLTLNEAAVCNGGCVGWGFFLNHHRSTLDAEGEWFYDSATNRVYLVSNSGPPADGTVLGSVVGTGDVEDQSGVLVGGAPFHFADNIVVDNLKVRDWAGNGIQLGRLLQFEQDKNVVIRNNSVINVAAIGIRLTSFVFDSTSGPDGLRGGTNGLVQNNLIDGANIDGIEMYSVGTVIERNTVRNIGLLANLAGDGLGCELTGNACGVHANGIRLKVDPNLAGFSGFGNTIRLNHLEQIGWTGIDLWGPMNLVERNVVVQPSVTLAEGAGIRTFGGNSFATTPAHDITIQDNFVYDSVGNVDGVRPAQHFDWGYGINVDHFSDAISVVGNTVAGSTAYGIIYAQSRGPATDNTLWDNTIGPSGVAHFRVLDAVSRVTLLRNAIYGRAFNRPVLSIDVTANLIDADDNYYFNPYDARLVRDSQIQETPLTLAAWQAVSGLDLNTQQVWYNLTTGDPDISELFTNQTESADSVPLAQPYLDLDQQVVTSPLNLGPFTSRILVAGADIIFADGFQSGDTSLWSATVP